MLQKQRRSVPMTVWVEPETKVRIEKHCRTRKVNMAPATWVHRLILSAIFDSPHPG